MDADKKPSPKALILQSAKAARTFTHEIAGRSFTLELPGEHDMRVASLRGKVQKDDPAAGHLMTRELVKTALVDWSKVTVADFMKNDDKRLVPFDADLVPELFAAQDDWYMTLVSELSRRVSERSEALGVAQKN